ncbi:hypothetical protein Ae201684P_006639 [Aphanomyces euteiches]|uniref:Uncharacterized protein n=1 Tax=Aphanomyces euteiches TaxID=100861 RepID=A0A6G0WUZ8_9STRA|nr:hypothetical protein Ae201684_011363 [Aphanomyces euteiches]KAH9100442.1 hypothetical protein Ae201684P_006639 [Aphanomyces euteiches]
MHSLEGHQDVIMDLLHHVVTGSVALVVLPDFEYLSNVPFVAAVEQEESFVARGEKARHHDRSPLTLFVQIGSLVVGPAAPAIVVGVEDRLITCYLDHLGCSHVHLHVDLLYALATTEPHLARVLKLY